MSNQKKNMKIAVEHTKNPAMGWDINVRVAAESNEKISFVQVRINGVVELDEAQNDPVDQWEKLLTQKGVYPGDNEVEVLVQDQNGKNTRAKQEWTVG